MQVHIYDCLYTIFLTPYGKDDRHYWRTRDSVMKKMNHKSTDSVGNITILYFETDEDIIKATKVLKKYIKKDKNHG